MYRRDPTSSKSVGVDHRLKKLSKISIVAIDIQIFSQVLRIPGFFVQIPEPDSNTGSCIRVINYQGQFEFALPSASLGSLIKVVKINVKNGNLCPTSELKLSNIVGENCFQSKSRSRSLYPPNIQLVRGPKRAQLCNTILLFYFFTPQWRNAQQKHVVDGQMHCMYFVTSGRLIFRLDWARQILSLFCQWMH